MSSVDGVAAGERLVVTLSDGELDCTVNDVRRIHSAVEALGLTIRAATSDTRNDRERKSAMSDAANLDEKKPVEELTFREALSELESIVSVLESNTLELEESLAAYERGVVLLGSLQKRLQRAAAGGGAHGRAGGRPRRRDPGHDPLLGR